MKIENEFIPYEQALALKELGFDEYCLGLYAYASKNTVDMQHVIHTCKASSKLNWMRVPTPTFSQASRWFREKYCLNSFIVDSKSYSWYFNINDMQTDDVISEVLYFKTYEEAELECLKKLIEIVKEQK